MNVDAVHQRPRDLGAVAKDLRHRASAFPVGVRVETTRTTMQRQTTKILSN
jgi:hypothetical protein